MPTDSSNQIDLVVNERGVSDAAKVIVVLADASDRAEKSVGKLKAQLADMKASGLAETLRVMQSYNGVVSESTKATTTYTTAQRASADASRAQAQAAQVESQTLKGLVGTKTELREIERTVAAEGKAASAAAKQYLAEEASARAKLTAEVLAERAASDELTASRIKQDIETTRQIELETQLGRARELAALKSDIISRNPAVSPSAQKAQEQVAANEAVAASNAQLIAQYANMGEAESGIVAMQQAEIGEIDILQAAYLQLADAQAEVTSAKAGYREIQSTINKGWFSEAEAVQYSATAMQRNMEAAEALAGAKANLAEVQEYVNATTIVDIDESALATAATNARTASVAELAGALSILRETEVSESAANASGTGTRLAAQSSLALMEGRTMGVTRAAGRMIATLLEGAGALASFIGIAVGVIAVVVVFSMIYNKIDETITKVKEFPTVVQQEWDKATDSLLSDVVRLETETDKMQDQLDKLNNHPGQNGLVVQFDMASDAAIRLGTKIDDDISKMDELLKKNQTTAWQRFWGAGDATNVVGAVMGDDRKIQDIKKNYETVFEQIRNDDSLTAEEKTSQIRANQERELGRIQEAYRAGDDYLKRLITDAQNGLGTIGTSQGKAFGLTYSSDLVGKNRNVNDLQMIQQTAAEALRLRQVDQTDIGDQYRKDTLSPQLEQARNAHAIAGEAGKAAREQWKLAEESFKQYRDTIIASGKTPTAQQEYNWWQHPTSANGSALGMNLGDNADKQKDQIGKYGEQINQQQTWANNQVAQLQRVVAAEGQYGEQLKQNAALNKYIQEIADKGIDPATVAVQTAAMRSLAAAEAANLDYDKALSETSKNKKMDAQAYQNAMIGLQEVIQRNPELASTAEQEQRKLTEQYKASTDPMYTIEQQYKDITVLMGLYGQAQTVEGQVQQWVNAQRKDGNEVTTQQIQHYRDLLNSEMNQKQLNDDLTKGYLGEADALKKLVTQQLALDQAHGAGKLGNDAYGAQTLQNEGQQAQLKMQNNEGGFGSIIGSSLAKYTSQFQSFADSATNILGDMWNKIGQGAAQTLSHLIVYGGNARQALKALAQEILQTLLSALIQVAIEAAAVKLGLAFLGFSGGGAVPDAGAPSGNIAKGMGFAKGGLAKFAMGGMIGAFAAGGLPAYAQGSITGPGTGTSDSILAWLSNGEYVMDAQSTKMIGVDNLDAIRRGAKAVGMNSPGIGGAGLSVPSTKGTKFTIEDHTAGVKWQTVQVGENEMRVIARDEGKKAVYAHTDDATGQNLGNGNSKTRKSLHQSTTARPLR